MKKILIGLPTMGSMHTLLSLTILKWVIESEPKGYHIYIYPTMSVQPVDNARNEIVKEFLNSECDYLFFIDSDTIPPPNALDELLKVDADIVSGITPIIELDENRINDSSGFYKRSNVIAKEGGLLAGGQGIQDMKACGGSCLLIKRKVIEELSKPIFRFVYKDCHPEGVEFDTTTDDVKSNMISEDYYFCAKALDKGFTLKCNTDVICRHQKSIMF